MPTREPFGPLIARSQRGVMHRAQPGPTVHVRCRGGRPFVGELIDGAEATRWATGREWTLCRYPWCFREVVAAAGIDPQVGHVARDVSIRGLHGERPVAPEHHSPQPAGSHPTEGWAVCDCGQIIVRARRSHNPDQTWWSHKGNRGPRREVAAELSFPS